jgi:ApaG protein
MARMESLPHAIEVAVSTRFLDDQSLPEEARYVFSYTVRLHNRGQVSAQLISRHWLVTDANGKVQEVHGEGVLGEQPRLAPGERYEYTSGAVLETAIGTMHGHYLMLADDGTRFEATVAPFTLAMPRTLH